METEVVRPSKWLYIVSLSIFVIGIVLFCNVLITGIKSSVNTINNQVIVPGTNTVELKEPGKYTIFFEYRSVIDGRVFESESINGLMCTLKKIDSGEFIELKNSSVNSTYSVNGREGKSIFSFNIDEAGNYELDAWYETGNGSESVLVIGKGFGTEIIRTIILCVVILFASIGTSITIFIVTYRKRKTEDIM